jgi:hypothetical protein
MFNIKEFGDFKIQLFCYLINFFGLFKIKSRKNLTKSNKKEFFLDLKVFFLDLNLIMVAMTRPLWYLPHGCYGTYHTGVMVATIMYFYKIG